MIEEIKTLIKHTLIYGVGGVVNGLVRLALIPIISQHISPAWFGIYSLLLMTISFLFLIFDLGLSYALMKWHNECDEPEKRKRVVGTGLTTMMSLGSILRP